MATYKVFFQLPLLPVLRLVIDWSMRIERKERGSQKIGELKNKEILHAKFHSKRENCIAKIITL